MSIPEDFMDWYVISDHHFGHRNIIKYADRRFDTVEEMDSSMIDSWNSVVSPSDNVLHLGDIFLCRTSRMFEVMDSLNWNKIEVVRGNHDAQSVTKFVERLGFDQVHEDYLLYNLRGYNIAFSHQPLTSLEMVESFIDFNVHGHTHRNLHLDSGVHYCVSVECLNYYPIKVKEIVEILSERRK